jgi:hypothetical protein
MPKYAQSRRDFYLNEVDDKKPGEIIMILKRVNDEKVKAIDDEGKKYLKEFVADCRKSFEAWAKHIESLATTTNE